MLKIRKFVIGVVIILTTIFTISLLVAPPIIVHLVTNGHVDYGVIKDHPLQKIYTSSDFELISNDMMLTTEDNYKVWVSEVTVSKPKAIIIYLSGIRQPSVTYFYGHAKWMKSEGYASFLLEVRGHGNSSGNRVCLGYEEVSDVKAVVTYIKQQEHYRDVPVVIHGVSMGGAIAVNSFGQLKEISGLIAMSAYSSFEDVVADTMEQYYIPGFIRSIEKQLIRVSLKSVFGDKVDEIKPIRQIDNIEGRPVLFIASVNDTQVSSENMNRLLKEALGHCESWLRDSDMAGHFIILNNDIENVCLDTEYCEKILSFLENKIVGKTR